MFEKYSNQIVQTNFSPELENLVYSNGPGITISRKAGFISYSFAKNDLVNPRSITVIKSKSKSYKKSSDGLYYLENKIIGEGKGLNLQEVYEKLKIEEEYHLDNPKIATLFEQAINNRKTFEISEDLQNILNEVNAQDNTTLDEVNMQDNTTLDKVDVQDNTTLDEVNMQKNTKSTTFVGKKIEKNENFVKTTRYLNNIEINSTIEYPDGSYDKTSRVFVSDQDLNVSKDYINYTSYKIQYDAKNKRYLEKEELPIIDENRNVIGEQKYIKNTDIENGLGVSIEENIVNNQNGHYKIKTTQTLKGDSIISENCVMNIDNSIGKKEERQYSKEVVINDGKETVEETFLYKNDGVIDYEIKKTDNGTAIDKYENGQLSTTYKYDEYGNPIILMRGLEKLPEDYVKNCFENAMPKYTVIPHEEPDEIYSLDEIDVPKEYLLQAYEAENINIDDFKEFWEEIENEEKTDKTPTEH